MCLQETWLKETNNILMKNFQSPVRKERVDQNRGGVLIFVRDSIPFTQITYNIELEVVGCKILVGNMALTICNLYVPPKFDNNILLAELGKLKDVLDKPFIITTDFNAHHYSWGSSYVDARGKILNDWVLDNNYVVVNAGDPTYVSETGSFTHIDITITSNNFATRLNWETAPELYNSDHYPILVDLDVVAPVSKRLRRWCLKSANWDGYRDSLVLPDVILDSTVACNNIINHIKEAAHSNNNVKVTEGCTQNSYCKTWWNGACRGAWKEKKVAFNRYKKKRDMETFIIFKKARALLRRVISQARQDSWDKYVDSIDSTTKSAEVWKRIKAIDNRVAPVRRMVLKEGNKYIYDEFEIANSFAKHYSKICTTDSNIVSGAAGVVVGVEFQYSQVQNYNKDFSMHELRQALDCTRSSSPGPDFVPIDFLKQMTEAQLQQMLKFYNHVWNTGLPDQWKECITIPLLKYGKVKTSIESYRPISLTNNICKVLERMVTKRLNHILESKKSINHCQSGYRKKHSAIDALCRIENSIRYSFMRGEHCIAVFLDISNAFDTVHHIGLMKKLNRLGIKGNMAMFIKDFLEGRTLSVRIGNEMSSKLPVTRGVPQGSVISPILFAVMINDMFDEVGSDIHYSLYADDGAMWSTCSTVEEGLANMQVAIDKVLNWCQNWGFKLTAMKTKAMVFSRFRKFPILSLKLENHNIEFVSKIKFLGVILDKQLRWGPYIKKLLEKCKGDLRILAIVGGRRWGAKYATLKRVYNALILSKLNYAGLLYDTAAKSHLMALNRIQYAAARTMLGALKCTPVAWLEAEANLLPLSYQRKESMTKYASRVLTIERHPVRDNILNFYPYQYYNHIREVLPISGRIYYEFKNARISLEDAVTMPLSIGWDKGEIWCKATLHECIKSMLNTSQWCALYSDLMNEKQEYIPVFCDGSVHGGRAGCGVFSQSFKLKSRISNSCSILSAELSAIYFALKFLSNLPHKYIILTDSLSAISLINQNYDSNHYVVSKISQLLTSKCNRIIIEWVPSHMGIYGNEMADKLAKEAVDLPINSSKVPFVDMKRHFKQHYYKMWQINWSRSGTTFNEIKPLLEESVCGTRGRREQKVLARLRLRTCQFTHKHLFERKQPEMCPSCQSQITVEHILISCPIHLLERRKLTAACIALKKQLTLEVVLGKEFPAEVLLAYLRNIKYLEKI